VGEICESALYAATLYSRIEVITLLLRAGANPNRWDDEERPFLHVAVWRNSMNAVELILKESVDTNSCDRNGNTALHELMLDHCGSECNGPMICLV
jgi:ankyrin repeat protein